jgi:hypothetical protein
LADAQNGAEAERFVYARARIAAFLDDHQTIAALLDASSTPSAEAPHLLRDRRATGETPLHPRPRRGASCAVRLRNLLRHASAYLIYP